MIDLTRKQVMFYGSEHSDIRPMNGEYAFATVENRSDLFSTVWKRGFQRIDKALWIICRSVSDLPRLFV